MEAFDESSVVHQSGYGALTNDRSLEQSGYERSKNDMCLEQSGYERSTNDRCFEQSGYERSTNDRRLEQSGYERSTNDRRLEQDPKMDTGKKHYECTICGKDFTYGSHLKRHLMAHTERKTMYVLRVVKLVHVLVT